MRLLSKEENFSIRETKQKIVIMQNFLIYVKSMEIINKLKIDLF